MSYYSTQIVYISLPPPQNIVCAFMSGTGFIFTFQLSSYATGCEYTTDGGLTFLPCQSGVLITKKSDGTNITAGNSYNFQFRQVEGSTKWFWSDVYQVFSVADTAPSIKAGFLRPQERGVVFRGFITDDGGTTVGCEVWVVVDDIETPHRTGLFKNTWVEIFRQLSEGRHKYKFAIKNLWGTVYTNETFFIFERGFVKMETYLNV